MIEILLTLYVISAIVALIRVWCFAQAYAPFTLEELAIMAFNVLCPIRNTWFALKRYN